MNKFLLKISCIFISMPLTAQVLYINICKTPCNTCKPSEPMKVEYKADPSKQIVLRLIDDKDVHVVKDCTVLDKVNWSCDGSGMMKNYGKQYAANGIAYWNDSEPLIEYERKYGKNYYCTYDKNIFGQLKLRQ